MSEKYLSPNKEDTLEDAIFAVRVLAKAIAIYMKDKDEVIVELDGNYYVVASEKGQCKIFDTKEVI